MNTRWIPITVTAIGCLMATGCTGAGQDAGPAARPGAAGQGTDDARTECPVGKHRVTRITPGPAIDADGLRVQLSGGTSMTIEFTGDGEWILRDSGKKRLKATVAAPGVGRLTGTARIRGKLSGTYAQGRDNYTFTQGTGTGIVVLRSSVGSDHKSITAVGPALVPDGTATVTCSGDKTTIKSENATLTLRRIGDSGSGEGEQAGGGNASGGGGGDGGDPSGAGTLVLKGPSRVHNVNCRGREIVASGSAMTVNLEGKCSRVRVTGNSNTVNIDRADAVTITGAGNVINIDDANAKIDNRGASNGVNQQ